MLTEPLRNVIFLAKLNICSQIQTVMFSFGPGRLFGNIWAGKLFSSAPVGSYEYLSVQCPPQPALYSIVLPLILKEHVGEW